MGNNSFSGNLLVISLGAAARITARLESEGVPADHVIWLDPLAVELPAAWAGQSRLTHLEGLLAETEGEAKVIRHSLPGVVSLAPASAALRALFPGLRAKGEIVVPELTAADLGAALGEGEFDLILDAPGHEHVVLEILAREGLLERVRRLELRAGVEAFFEGARDLAELRGELEERLFRVLGEDATDPDWPVLHLERDRLRLRLGSLEADLGRADAALAAREAELQQVRADLGAREAQLAARDAALKTAAEALAAREAEVQKGAADLAARDAALSAAKTDAEAQKAELAARDAALKTAAETLAARDKTLAETKTKLAAQQALVIRQRDDLRALEEKIARRDAEIAQLRRDMSLALQTQSSSQAAFDMLRERHGVLMQEKDRLETLIRQLTPRLQEAAGHLRRLAPAEAEPAPQPQDKPPAKPAALKAKAAPKAAAKPAVAPKAAKQPAAPAAPAKRRKASEK